MSRLFGQTHIASPSVLERNRSDQKGGVLVIGSTGKARSNDGVADGIDKGGRGQAASDDPEKIIEDELWIKMVGNQGGGDLSKITHVDARGHYHILENAAACPSPGWVVHESCRWSSSHSMWFFLPRKICRDAYNVDTATFTTLIMAVPEHDQAVAWDKWDTNDAGDGVLVQQAPLGGHPLRGVSDFTFVPGTGDCHIFVLRTEVSKDTFRTVRARFPEATAVPTACKRVTRSNATASVPLVALSFSNRSGRMEQ